MKNTNKTLIFSLILLLVACSKNEDISTSAAITSIKSSEDTSTEIKSQISAATYGKSSPIVIESNTNNSSIISENHISAVTHGDNSPIVIGTGNSNINYNGSSVIINGKEGSNPTTLSGSHEFIKLPISGNSFKNILPLSVQQVCDHEDYIKIDKKLSALIDMQALKSGELRLKNGQYNLNNFEDIVLSTQHLNKLFSNGTGNISINCVSENFELINSGTGDININVLNNLVLNNNGTGNITVEKAVTLDLVNNGTGDVLVKKVEKIVNLKNHGTGSVAINP